MSKDEVLLALFEAWLRNEPLYRWAADRSDRQIVFHVGYRARSAFIYEKIFSFRIPIPIPGSIMMISNPITLPQAAGIVHEFWEYRI